MVKLTVYSTENGFDLSDYTDVDTRVEDSNRYYYTNNDKFGATMFSYDYTGDKGKLTSSPLFLGHATVFDFEQVAAITGRIGGEKVATWLAGKDLADYTPESLEARIFVGDDKLRGNIGNDLLDGHAGADTLKGKAGDDFLIGGGGDDILVGGFGADTLTGGFGADHFVIRQRYDLVGGTETITDFSHGQGDVIDVSRFGEIEGQQSLTFVGEAAFSGAGVAEVRVDVTSAELNTLQFDTNGDGKIDVSLSVHTATVLDATDVVTLVPPTDTAFGADTPTVAHLLLEHLVQPVLAGGVLA